MTLPSMRGSSWNLAPDVAAQAQGLVSSGFGHLPAACALVLSAGAAGGHWLAELLKIAPVTTAAGKATPSVALAFTSLGLAQIGLSDEIMSGFSLPFLEGMLQKDRRRGLGDAAAGGAPLASIRWGLRPEPDAPAATGEPPVHALLLLYHETHDALVDLVEKAIAPALSDADVRIVRRLALDLSVGKTEDVREHFGFVDGVSQPIPYGAGTVDGAGKEVAQDPLHGVPLGEILLGHPDAHRTTSSGPFMPGSSKSGASTSGASKADGFVPSRATTAAAAVAAVKDPASEEQRDLGLNGSYLVVRELRQDVDAFWASMEAAAADLDIPDLGLDLGTAADASAGPGTPSRRAIWLAERVIGRTRDGDALRPGGPLPPVHAGNRDVPDNDFLYYLEDRYGRGCPMGSHVRRANPRDGLAHKDEVCADLLRSANAHRILRRGRKYGPEIGRLDPTSGTGLLFICLNGDIARQFEFVQQNWMLNPNFATLYDEVDPLVGPAGQMTLPAAPLRRRVHVETFVTLVGGDYFFLPSLTTLDILAAL